MDKSDRCLSVGGSEDRVNLVEYQPRAESVTSSQRALQQVNGKTLSFQEIMREVYYQLGYILRKAVPASLQSVVWFLTRMYTIRVIGHSGDENELAGASLGFTYMAVLGWSVIIGIGGGLDTYASQSFTGNKKMTGIYLQKCLVVTSLACIPIGFLFYNSAFILNHLGQNPAVTHWTQRYTRIGVLDLLPSVFIIDMVKFLQAQGIFFPVVVIQLGTLPLFIGLQSYFVFNLFGFEGAPLAVTLVDVILAAALIVYARFFNGYQAWSGLSSQAYRDLKGFLKVAGNSILQVCTEWWASEISTLLCGLLSTLALAGQSVAVSTSTLFWTLFQGVISVASVQVGNFLGAKNPQKAKLTARLALCLTFGISSVCAIVISIFRKQLVLVYTDNEGVIQTTASLIPIVGVGSIFDGMSGTAGGILRGLGHQRVGAIVSTCNFYFLTIPLAVLLAFYFKLNIHGIWLGFLAGFIINASILVTYLWFVDWDKAVEDAQRRIGTSEDDQSQQKDDIQEPLLQQSKDAEAGV